MTIAMTATIVDLRVRHGESRLPSWTPSSSWTSNDLNRSFRANSLLPRHPTLKINQLLRDLMASSIVICHGVCDVGEGAAGSGIRVAGGNMSVAGGVGNEGHTTGGGVVQADKAKRNDAARICGLSDIRLFADRRRASMGKKMPAFLEDKADHDPIRQSAIRLRNRHCR